MSIYMYILCTHHYTWSKHFDYSRISQTNFLILVRYWAINAWQLLYMSCSSSYHGSHNILPPDKVYYATYPQAIPDQLIILAYNMWRVKPKWSTTWRIYCIITSHCNVHDHIIIRWIFTGFFFREIVKKLILPNFCGFNWICGMPHSQTSYQYIFAVFIFVNAD